MINSRVKSLVVTSILSILTVFPAFVSQVEARGVAVEGPRGNEAAAVQGPRGNEAVAVKGPRGDEAVAVEGPRGGVAVGARVNVLPYTARPVVVGGKSYYRDGGRRHAADGRGAEAGYVVVPAPAW